MIDDKITPAELKRLCKRSEVLLLLIDARSTSGLFYVPKYGTEYLTIGPVRIETHVSGAGDGSAIRALVSKGLVEKVAIGDNWLVIGYRVTAAGRDKARDVSKRLRLYGLKTVRYGIRYGM
jgi:hypothetical protein